MARRRGDEPTPAAEDVVADYRSLVAFGMASDDLTLSESIHDEADRLGRLPFDPEQRFALLRALIGDLGYGDAADRHVALMRRARRTHMTRRTTP